MLREIAAAVRMILADTLLRLAAAVASRKHPDGEPLRRHVNTYWREVSRHE